MSEIMNDLKLLRPTYHDGIAGYNLWCPSCDCIHHITLDRWNVTGDIDKSPTIKPSLNTKIPELLKGTELETMAQSGYFGHVCHFIITDGKIRYITAVNDKYRGKTIDMIAF